ncbi:hypothetical protein HD806DRAFT_226294 [Xylariaceae sp. AK1471]|nr:hypothetical protein HD806DRAFT_226294 [Xylariaceae sp. AK1471]
MYWCKPVPTGLRRGCIVSLSLVTPTGTNYSLSAFFSLFPSWHRCEQPEGYPHPSQAPILVPIHIILPACPGGYIGASLDCGVGTLKAVFQIGEMFTMPIRPHHGGQYWSQRHTVQKSPTRCKGAEPTQKPTRAHTSRCSCPSQKVESELPLSLKSTYVFSVRRITSLGMTDAFVYEMPNEKRSMEKLPKSTESVA